MTMQVTYSSMDGWEWIIRDGIKIIDAGTGYSREDAMRRGKLAMRQYT